MNNTIEEVIDYLKSCDIEPTKENIKATINKWIKNLYSHVGAEAHQHSVLCGVEDLTGMTWEEQDIQMLKQIEDYKNCLTAIGGETA